MNNSTNILRLIIIFIVVMLAQFLFLGNLDFLELCNPFIYIVFIMFIPFGCSTTMLMILSFFTGLVVDLFSNTPGMHAAACVLIAFCRQYILQSIAFRNAYKSDDMPSVSQCGSVWYTKYTIMMVCIHHVALFLIEQFDSFYLVPTLIRIVLSILASSLCIILFAHAIPNRSLHNVDD